MLAAYEAVIPTKKRENFLAFSTVTDEVLAVYEAAIPTQ